MRLTRDTTAPARRLFNGRRVLLLIVASLGAYTVLTFAIGYLLDAGRARSSAEKAAGEARQWNAAWAGVRGAPLLRELAQVEDALARGAWKQAEVESRGVIARYVQAFRNEQARLRAEFETHVVMPWRKELAPCFPFDSAAESDASMAAVRRIFGPNDGDYWRYAAEIERLGAIEIGGLRVAPPPDNYTSSMQHAGALRDALFDGQGNLEVRLRARIMGQGALLEVGDQRVPGGRQEMTSLIWNGQPVRLTAGSTDALSDDGPWSLLRLLSRLGSPRRYAGLSEWRAGESSLEIEADADLLDLTLFSRFNPARP